MKVTKAIMSVVLSATMALPLPSFARNEAFQPDVMEDVPVIMETAALPGGGSVTLIGAAIPADRNEELVESLAKRDPENLILQVSGPEDAVLKTAARTGYLKHIKTYITGSAEQTPMFQDDSLTPSLKEKLKAKIQAIKRIVKPDTAVDLMFTAIYAGVQGGFTWYASSSVDSGLAVAGMYMLWNTAVLVKPQFWGKALEYGGRGATALGERVAALCGRKMDEREKRIFEVAGKFAVSWAVNSAQGAYVKQWAGDFQGLHGWQGLAEGFADSGVSGVQNNYNIWDAFVMKKYEDRALSEKQVKWYFRGQLVVGAVLESLAFRGVPFVGLFLGTVTTAGALYLTFNPEKQDAYAQKAMKISVAFRQGVAYINNSEFRRSSNQSLRRRVAAQVQTHKSACAKALERSLNLPQIYTRQSYNYEDVQ